MKLTNKKAIFYIVFNIILLLLNVIFYILQKDNPLNITWLMVVYFVISILFTIYLSVETFRVVIKKDEIEKTSWRYRVFDWLGFVLMPISIFILIFANFFSNGFIVGDSMKPTLKDGNTIIIYKFHYQPKRDDVVIIKYEDANNQEDEIIIKRIVAVPGDVVKFVKVGYVNLTNEEIQGKIFINDVEYQTFNSPALFTKSEFIRMFKEFYESSELLPVEMTVPENYYLALGDNFYNSEDSRRHGLFHISKIGGKMIISFGGEKNESN